MKGAKYKKIFLEKHLNLTFELFEEYSKENNYKSIIGKSFIELAREELDYKKSTTSVDIYNSLHNEYDRIMKVNKP